MQNQAPEAPAWISCLQRHAQKPPEGDFLGTCIMLLQSGSVPLFVLVPQDWGPEVPRAAGARPGRTVGDVCATQ